MKKLYFIILLFVIIPIKVNAASLEFNCPINATPNSEVTCTIQTSDSLKGIKLLFSLPNEITTTKVTTNWTNHYKKNKGLVITPINQDSLNASITLKISDQVTLGTEYDIGLINIEASDNEHNILTIDDIYTKIKILSDDNTLSNLSITNGSLTPTFNKNKTTYTATVNNDKTYVTATPSFNQAKVEGNIGEVKLNYGINKLNITVTSEFGTTKTYSITITRPLPEPPKTNNNKPNSSNNNTKNNNNQNQLPNINNSSSSPSVSITKSNDASLKEIKIKDHYLDFKSNKYSYKLKVKNDETTLDITAIPNNTKSKVEIDKPETLEVGDNSIIITVTAEDGTICKYEIIVTREKEKITTKNKNIDITDKKEKSNKKISLFPSVPLAITILLVLTILLILFIILKRIFKKDN